MKVLVTGAGGFMGSHLVDSLVDLGHTVYSLDDLSWGYIENVNSKSKFIQLDLQNKSETEAYINEIKPEYIFHLAADATEGRRQPPKQQQTQQHQTNTTEPDQQQQPAAQDEPPADKNLVVVALKGIGILESSHAAILKAWPDVTTTDVEAWGIYLDNTRRGRNGNGLTPAFVVNEMKAGRKAPDSCYLVADPDDIPAMVLE